MLLNTTANKILQQPAVTAISRWTDIFKARTFDQRETHQQKNIGNPLVQPKICGNVKAVARVIQRITPQFNITQEKTHLQNDFWQQRTVLQLKTKTIELLKINSFFLFFGLNCFGAGAKKLKILEPELEPKKLDARSWNRSLKFEYRLHSPASLQILGMRRTATSWRFRRRQTISIRVSYYLHLEQSFYG